MGGSHAQRDVIDLTLIAAAARSGNVPLAEALLATRVERKPSAMAAGLELIRANSDGGASRLRGRWVERAEGWGRGVGSMCVGRWGGAQEVVRSLLRGEVHS